MNPFLENDKNRKTRAFTFARAIETQVLELGVGDSGPLGTGSSSDGKVRTAVWKIGERHNMKFSVRKSDNGQYWVKRIK